MIDVLTAVITANKGEHIMTSIAEEAGTAPATATGGQPKPAKKARVAPRRAHVAPKKGKSAKKASPPKKAPKAAKKVGTARAGSDGAEDRVQPLNRLVLAADRRGQVRQRP